MKKTYKIVVHIRPWEIDQFEYQLKQLIKNSYYILDNVILYVNMDINNSNIDYENSNIKKEYFISKFNYLNEMSSKYFISKFKIVDDLQLLTTRRYAINDNDSDYIIWLDPDVYFNQYTLLYLINATKTINENKFILSPNTIKYWDSSWDCLTNSKYLNQPYNHRDFFDSFSIDSDFKDDVKVLKNNTVKIGGGWFNLFSNELLQEIKIPDSFGGYGPDDTFVAIISDKLNYPQYILDGCIVTELGKYLADLPNFNYIKDNLNIIDNKEKIKPSDDIMLYEIKNFLKNKKI